MCARTAAVLSLCIMVLQYNIKTFSLTLITFAYLTYEDVQRIPNLKEQTVIVIKAPPGTKLEVPHPVEVCFCSNRLPFK